MTESIFQFKLQHFVLCARPGIVVLKSYFGHLFYPKCRLMPFNLYVCVRNKQKWTFFIPRTLVSMQTLYKIKRTDLLTLIARQLDPLIISFDASLVGGLCCINVLLLQFLFQFTQPEAIMQYSQLVDEKMKKNPEKDSFKSEQ